jgi:hypothetical protein
MAEPTIKPIGFKPDGSHIHKGSLFIAVALLIGLYCIVSDAPFSWLFGTCVHCTEVVN